MPCTNKPDTIEINDDLGKSDLFSDVLAVLPGHTKEDRERLMTLAMKAGLRRYQKSVNNDCRSGIHGFNTEAAVGGGRIHTRCTNCGESWSSPDVPYR